MSYGQQPGGNGQYPGNGYNNGYNYQQQGYGAPYNPQYSNGAATVNTNASYSYERAEHVSVTKAYGEMTIGLLVTAVVAILTQMTGLYLKLIAATGVIGVWLPAIVEVVLVFVLAARIMKMQTSTARALFYIYAALNGFSMSIIFAAYDISTIGIAFGICAVYFLALTMFGLTTKGNMLKAGPILMIGLIVLIVAELVIYIFFPTQTALMWIAAIGLILFSGLTVYDAQFTKRAFASYANQGPQMIERISILCALNLYLDFINIFLYILQLFGNSRD